MNQTIAIPHSTALTIQPTVAPKRNSASDPSRELVSVLPPASAYIKSHNSEAV